MKTYLEPLKKETFLSNTEINALFGNIQEIFGFQQQFLQTLENALETEAQFLNLDSPAQFKVRHLTSVLFTSRYRPASQRGWVPLNSKLTKLVPFVTLSGEHKISRYGNSHIRPLSQPPTFNMAF